MQNYDDVQTIKFGTIILAVKFTLNGQNHRTDGPAIICYYSDGTIESKAYWLNGKKHREDGPAEIEYHSDGSIQMKKYYLHGIPMEGF